MEIQTKTLEAVLGAINDIKKTGFDPESVELDFYLGGDLGVDSKEMLEIWYELEQRLSIRVMDEEKRDLYTLGDVVSLLSVKLLREPSPA
jgi:acyl carrier protein